MSSRMDRYHNSNHQDKVRRLEKNSLLYQDLSTNKVFTGFSNVKLDNAIDLTKVSRISNNKREDYHKNKVFNEGNQNNFSGVTQEIRHADLLPDNQQEERIYNVNDVLEMAKKNRDADDLEKKRKLRMVEYNILADLSQDKLNEYKDKKHDKLSKDEEENLEELINTITSGGLRKKIDNELLGDLLPTKEDETLISKQLVEELQEKISQHDLENSYSSDREDEKLEKTVDKIDRSFYSKSMDLSLGDLIDSQEVDESFAIEESRNYFKIVMIVLFFIVIVSIICYIIFKFI